MSIKKSELRHIIKEEIQKLFEEAPPPGFVAKRAKTICKKVSRKLGDSTDFYVTGKIHDDYLKDEISSINFGFDTESEINVFRKSGYSDEEIKGVYAELKQAKGKTVDLPKPISLTFTVFKRK